MKTVQGDLIKLAMSGEFDVIIHGCNCQCVMGAGIAKLIKSKFPEAFSADQETGKGDISKLGTISCAEVQRGTASIVIVNGYTQAHWRGIGMKVSYDAIRGVMREVKLKFSGSRIGLPKIGAGLAGGDWDKIFTIIEEELADEEVTVVEFSG